MCVLSFRELNLGGNMSLLGGAKSQRPRTNVEQYLGTQNPLRLWFDEELWIGGVHNSCCLNSSCED